MFTLSFVNVTAWKESLVDKLVNLPEDKVLDVSDLDSLGRGSRVCARPKIFRKRQLFTELPIISSNYASYKDFMLFIYPAYSDISWELAEEHNDDDFKLELTRLNINFGLYKHNQRSITNEILLGTYPEKKYELAQLAAKDEELLEGLVHLALEDEDIGYLDLLQKICECF